MPLSSQIPQALCPPLCALSLSAPCPLPQPPHGARNSPEAFRPAPKASWSLHGLSRKHLNPHRTTLHIAKQTEHYLLPVFAPVLGPPPLGKTTAFVAKMLQGELSLYCALTIQKPVHGLHRDRLPKPPPERVAPPDCRAKSCFSMPALWPALSGEQAPVRLSWPQPDRVS